MNLDRRVGQSKLNLQPVTFKGSEEYFMSSLDQCQRHDLENVYFFVSLKHLSDGLKYGKVWPKCSMNALKQFQSQTMYRHYSASDWASFELYFEWVQLISQLNFKSLRVKHYFSYLLILPIALTIALINMNCDAKNETFMFCGIRHYFTALFWLISLLLHPLL